AFRAGVTARWAGLLLAVGAVLPVLTGFLPHAVARFAALPVGMALVGLGLSLWTAASTRQSRTPPVAAPSWRSGRRLTARTVGSRPRRGDGNWRKHVPTRRRAPLARH